MWKPTSESGAPDNSSQSHFSATVAGSVERRGTGIATPSSRRRVDGVEVDTTAPRQLNYALFGTEATATAGSAATSPPTDRRASQQAPFRRT